MADTSPADLEDRKIDLYLQKVYGKGRNDFDVPYSKLMSNLHIADKNGMLTLAGLLYFGSHPQQFKPAFNIKAVAFYGNLDGNNRNHLTTPTIFCSGLYSAHYTEYLYCKDNGRAPIYLFLL